MAFKQDEDFLRFLTMGAAGSAAVAHHLQDECGHRMIELERYTMANKIWGTKVKRLRLPDLICIDCGLRVEARAKSKLEIKVSDSNTPTREWDYGLRDDDLIAFVYWNGEEGRTAERPEYFSVAALRASKDAGASKLGPPKSATDGSERDRSWTARVPAFDGLVEEIVDERRVKARRAGKGKMQTFWLPRGVPSFIYASAGDEFAANERFLLGVVEPPATLQCPGRTCDHAAELDAPDGVTRYAAVKAAGILRDTTVIERLNEIAAEDEDERIRLEAWASLARIEPDRYTTKVSEAAANREADPSLAMEATFILSELGSDDAVDALLALARDRDRDSEARAAAVWGLGATGVERPDLVLEFIADEDDDVAMHALAGIGPLSDELIAEVQSCLRGSERNAASAMTLLARQGERGAAALLEAVGWAGDPRTWALAGLGQMSPKVVAGAGELPEEIAELIAPMWTRNTRNWLNRNEPDDALSFLERQCIRHAPPEVGVGP